jgi:tRNA U54 and U55 pseudouridine synthase Pus10
MLCVATTFAGRYKKFSRQLPQSPWILDGARKAQGSVQECITEYISPLFGASEARFHSAGARRHARWTLAARMASSLSSV